MVATIVPWNYPLLLLAWKVAPPWPPATPWWSSRRPTPRWPPCAWPRPSPASRRGGQPGHRRGRGRRGPGHSDGTSLVAFTGSVATGQRIGALCAERVKRTHLELGGKDAFIVCDDVDLEVAAPGAAWAAYLNAGQVCTSAERFYVLEPVFDEFVDRLVAVTKELRLGDPLDPATDVGPMVAEVQRAKVERQLDGPARRGPGPGRRRPRRPGARLVPGPDRGGGRGRQHGPAHHRDLRAGRPRAAGRLAGRGHRPGQRPPLRAGGQRLHRRMDYVLRCMEELEAGTVWFNDPLTDNDAGPFGGMKMSGNARELGPGPGGVPRDQARPPRRPRQPQAVVVSLRPEG